MNKTQIWRETVERMKKECPVDLKKPIEIFKNGKWSDYFIAFQFAEEDGTVLSYALWPSDPINNEDECQENIDPDGTPWRTGTLIRNKAN